MSPGLRVTFVGRESEVGHAVPAAAVGGLQPTFVEHRATYAQSRLLAHIAEHDPEVVVVFGVDSVPAAAIPALGVPAVAWIAAPDRPPGLERHPATPFASSAFRGALAGPADYARIVDRPLPAADDLFAAPRRSPGAPRSLVIGHSSPRLERLLVDSKHRHEVLHIAGGLRREALPAILAGSEVAINLRDDDRRGFGSRVGLYLAAGLLLMSEPLHPACGLKPGRDFVEIRSSEDLVEAIAGFRADPDMFTPMREAGRRAAEAFRASRIYTELLAPLVQR